MAKKRTVVLFSMNGKPPGKTYRTGQTKGKRPKSSLDRLALKTKQRRKRGAKAKR